MTFGHEKLHAYQVSLEYVKFIDKLCKSLKKGQSNAKNNNSFNLNL